MNKPQSPELYAIKKRRAELSLHSFVEQAWHTVEPLREFKTGFALQGMCEHLEAITLGYIIELLMNVPPGMMKSLLVNVFWPAWEWGPRGLSSLRHLSFSYKRDLTIRDNLRCRRVIESRWYQERWGDRFVLTTDQNAKTKFENDATGWCQAESVGGGTGDRGDRAKVDDPHNIEDGESDPIRIHTTNWFKETYPSRVNELGVSARLLIMQRVHSEDCSALAKEQGWTHFCLPMRHELEHVCQTLYLPNSKQCIERSKGKKKKLPWHDVRLKEGELLFPERFPAKELKKLEDVLGDYATAAQMQQRPGPRAGGMFKRDKFQIIEAVPINCVWASGWDFAGTKIKAGKVASARQAASARCLMGFAPDGSTIIAHMYREFLSPGELDQAVVTITQQDADEVGDQLSVSIPQDPGQAGKSQADNLTRKLVGFRVEATPESGDKVTRAQPFAAQVDARNVFLVRGDWNKPFLDEASIFPNGRKDQIDASSRAFDKLVRLTGRRKQATLGIPINDKAGAHNGGLSAVSGTSGAPNYAHPNSKASEAPHLSGAAQTERVVHGTGLAPLGGYNGKA